MGRAYNCDNTNILKRKTNQKKKKQCLKVMELLEQGPALQQRKIHYQEGAS